MKKNFLGIIMFLLTLITFINKVEANSFSIILDGSDTFDDEITIKLKISDYQDNSSSCNGICALSAEYSYNSSKLDLIKIEPLNDFRLLQGNGNIVLSKATGVSSGSDLVSFTFKNKGLSDGEEITFSMTNLNASNGDEDITGNNVSKKIKYVAPTESSNSSISQKTNSSSSSNDNKSSTNSASTTSNNSEVSSSSSNEKKSNNANLESLTINPGNLNFSENILSYNIVVDNSVNSIIVKAKSEDGKAKINGEGRHVLKDGNNKIEIEVTAEDGTKKTYTINITKDTVVEPDVATNNNDKIESTDKNKKITGHIIPLIICSIILLGIIIYIIIKKKRK